tara:strand:+ start:742 stop:4755 length:4014 start_codon:yes stop_codon:yes gene_type:complete
MADQPPLTIVEEEERPTDDVLISQQAQSLTIPETRDVPTNLSPIQDFNKINIDVDKAVGMGMDLPFLTKTVVQDLYKYQDAEGNYQRLPSGFYDAMKRDGLADQQILERFANVRNVGPFQQFMEQAAIEATATAPAIAAFTSAGPYGLAPAIGAGLLSYLTGDAYRRMMAPELELPYANKSGLAVSGQIFGGSVPGFQVPWLATKGSITLGADFIGNNLRRMPFATPTSNLLRRGENVIEQGLESARSNPLGFVLSEGKDVFTAAAAGYGMEQFQPGERGGANVAADLLAETAAVMLDPVSRTGRFIYNKVPGVQSLMENISLDRRMMNVGRRMAEILEKAGEDPEKIIRFLRGEDNKEYIALMNQAGIPFEDRTAALQTGVPILYYLEGLGAQRQTGRFGSQRGQEFSPDAAIAEQQQNARNVLNQFLADLIEFDTPESLAMYADLRDQNFRAEINNVVEGAYEAFDRARQNALTGGEAFDEKRQLYNIFFGEDGQGGVYGDIRRQSRVLRDLIPKNMSVSQAALVVPSVDDEPIGPEGLIDVYNRIGQELSIRGERPRLSYGSDLVSLDKVLREFDDYVNPPDASDVPELPSRQELFEIDVRNKERQIARKREEAANAPGDRRTRAYREQQAAFADDLRRLEIELNDLKSSRTVERAAEKTVGEPTEGQESVTTGELLNMLDVIGQSKRNAMAKGNQNLLGLLNEIETGVKNSLAFAGREAPASSSLAFRKTSPGGQFQVYFDNYLAFEDEVNNVFSQAFTGQMRRDIAPELAGYALFDNLGDTTLLRLRQMDDAANFLMNYDSASGVNVSADLDGALSAANEFAAASNVLDAAQLTEMQDNLQSGEPLLRATQDRVLKGLLDNPRYFRKVDVQDASGNFVMIPDPDNPGREMPLQRIEAQDGFNRFLNDPAVDNVLTQYFPTLRNDLQDVNSLDRIYRNMQNREGNLNKEIARSDRFVEFFQDRMDNPIEGIHRMLGTPGQDRITGRANPVRDFRNIATAAAESGDAQVKQGLIDVVLNHAYTLSGGFSPLDPQTNLQPFNLKIMLQYLNDPMVPGQRDSILDILSETDVLEEGNRQIGQINAVLRQMDKIDASLAPARGVELDPKNAAQVDKDLGSDIKRKLEEAGVGIFGAGIASKMYGLLARAGIVGGQGSLITSALGASVAREILSRNPQLMTQTLMTQMLKEPKVMADILELSRTYKPGDKLPRPQLQRMYTFLLGGGLVPVGTEFRDFADRYYGRSEEQIQQRREAIRTRGRQTSDSPFATQRPVPPQASAPQVAPPPVAQAPAPTFQTPAPTAQASRVNRQQFAAAFPFDVTSDVIRSQQGIGSLRG